MTALKMINSWIFPAFIIAFAATGVFASDDEYKLLQTLFEKYDTNNRPVANASQSLKITMTVALHQIIDLDETSQVLKTKLWITLEWPDAHLHWDPKDHGNIRVLNLAPGKIWNPDITLYQDISGTKNVRAYQQSFPVTINHTGGVVWNIPNVYHSSCDLNVRYFPFDEQSCPFKFGSWTYNQSYIDLVTPFSTANVSYFSCNGEWLLVGMPVKRHVVPYNVYGDLFVDLTYTLIIRRLPLYYLFNLVFPCLVITATAMLVFCLPPESGEKVNLGVTVLLTLTVFLLLVAQSVPPQSESIPLAGEYFATTIVLLALSTSLTVFSLSLHHRGGFGPAVPPTVRLLCLDWLATLMCMRKQVTLFRKQHVYTKTQGRGHPPGPTTNGTANVFTNVFTNEACLPAVPLETAFTRFRRLSPTALSEVDSRSAVTGPERRLGEIVGVLRELQASWEEARAERRRSSEWGLVAMVVDRVLFVVFITLTVVTALVILLQHPHYTVPDWPNVACHRP